MTDEGVKITVRLSPAENQLLEDFIADHDIDNRSDVIREAIKAFISEKEPNNGDGDGVFVRFTPIVLQAMENLRREGVVFDAESYVRQLVLSDLIPEEAIRASKERAFTDAQRASRML
ncbi:MAG: ribbon-helix-helix domain-containing protein [archaeon]|nr:ribbon-helix-helix domain-containing protein [archaeon]